MPRIENVTPGGFCWVELATTDQEAAKKFYSSLFGWGIADSPMGPGEVYTMFKKQDAFSAAAYTMRPEQKDQGVPPHWMLYIATSDADRTAARAGELGGKTLAPPFDVFDFGRMAVLQDPTGAIFSVWQPKMHQGLQVAGENESLCWADLSTPDVEGAKRFYEGLFGWKIAASEGDNSGYLHIQNGADFIGGVPPAQHRNPNAPPHWLLYFMVADCDANTARAKELGGRVYMGPMTIEKVGRMSVIADPQGAVFANFQPLPRE